MAKHRRSKRPQRPPGWWEAIDKAIADAPEPSPELADRVAGLLAPHLQPEPSHE